MKKLALLAFAAVLSLAVQAQHFNIEAGSSFSFLTMDYSLAGTADKPVEHNYIDKVDGKGSAYLNLSSSFQLKPWFRLTTGLIGSLNEIDYTLGYSVGLQYDRRSYRLTRNSFSAYINPEFRIYSGEKLNFYIGAAYNVALVTENHNHWLRTNSSGSQDEIDIPTRKNHYSPILVTANLEREFNNGFIFGISFRQELFPNEFLAEEAAYYPTVSWRNSIFLAKFGIPFGRGAEE